MISPASIIFYSPLSLSLMQAVTMTFIRSMFSLEAVDYTSVKTLADDILRLAKQTADTMQASATTLNDVNSLWHDIVL